jgi:hypothetical protein
MKIHSDPNIEAVRQEQAKSSKEGEPKKAFGEYLQQEAAKAPLTQSSAQGPAPPIMVSPFIQVGGAGKAEAASAAGPEAGQNVLAGVENVLSKWEDYASRLDSETDLRQAYGVLQDISAEVGKLKQNPGMAQQDPGVQSLVDEIEVLAVTEQVKFNRGDYL